MNAARLLLFRKRVSSLTFTVLYCIGLTACKKQATPLVVYDRNVQIGADHYAAFCGSDKGSCTEDYTTAEQAFLDQLSSAFQQAPICKDLVFVAYEGSSSPRSVTDAIAAHQGNLWWMSLYFSPRKQQQSWVLNDTKSFLSTSGEDDAEHLAAKLCAISTHRGGQVVQ